MVGAAWKPVPPIPVTLALGAYIAAKLTSLSLPVTLVKPKVTWFSMVAGAKTLNNVCVREIGWLPWL